MLIVLVASATSYGAYAHSHEGTAMPGVKVAGEDVTGMTRSEISELVENRFAASTVTFTVAGKSLDIPLVESGADIDESLVADAALKGATNPLSRLLTSVAPRSVRLAPTIDEEGFTALIDRLDALVGEAPLSASVELDDSGTSHRVIPGHAGRGVDRESVRTALFEASESMESTRVELEVHEIEPEVSTEEATQVAKEMDALLQAEVSLQGPKRLHEASAADKASWVGVRRAFGGLTTDVNGSAVREWLDGVVAAEERDPINAIDEVDANGTLLEPARPGKVGIDVTNVENTAAELEEAVKKGTGFQGVLTSREIPFETEQRVVANGPERFAYRARAGEKWVDVDLTDSTLTLYQGQERIYGPILINHGGVGHETVTGVYHVYLKFPAQDMGCTPEWPYCERAVPWVSYWHASYALHGAPWVEEFGIGTDESSHGCINIPVDEAKRVFDFAEIGTTVVTHR